MSNRVIKDLIWASPRLAECSVSTQLHFPRLLLLSDDWGCFNADCDIVKGLAYPKIKIIKSRIKTILNELNNKGLLFIWQTGHHVWGHWIKWEEHEWVSSTETNNRGERIKHRRKTPEPPSKLLEEYIKIHYLEQSGTTRDKLEQTTSYPNLNPNLNLNHKYITEIISYLNLKAKKNFRPDSKIAVKNITARLNEKYTIEDFKKVIDIKFSHWFEINEAGELIGVVIIDEKGREQDMSQYFNPETLFGNKFEKYLNQNANKEAIQEAKIKEKEWEAKKEKRDDYKHKPIPEKTYEILKDVIPKYRDKLKGEK